MIDVDRTVPPPSEPPGTPSPWGVGVASSGLAGWVRRLLTVAERRPLLTVGLVALTLRLLLAVALWGFGDPQSVAPDVRGYDHLAAEMAAGGEDWSADNSFFYREFATYLVPLTGLYWLFGPHPFLGQLLSVAFGVAAAVCIAVFALRFMQRRWGLAVGIAAAVLPSYVVWSSLTLRDGPVWAVTAATALTAALAITARDRRLALLGLTALVLALLMGHLRWPSTVVLGWALVVAMVFSEPRARLIWVLGGLVIALAVPWVIGLGVGGFEYTLDRDLGQMRVQNAVGAETAIVNPDALTGGADGSGGVGAMSGSALEFEGSGVSRQLDYLPTGLRVMLVEPLPWTDVRGSRMALVKLESIVWYPILALALALGGAIVAVRRKVRELVFPMVGGGGVLVAYALAEGNLGTAYRRRSEFTYTVLLLAGLGSHELVCRPPRSSPRFSD